MAAGLIGEFNHQSQDWMVYSERLEQYFCANQITDAKVKVATLISLIGSETYELLRDLCFPALPKEKNYEELTELLKKQFSPQTSVWRERIKFHSAYQTMNENVSEWYARIKSLAVNCEFQEHLEAMLKDRFVTGLQKGRILDRVCEENSQKSLTEMVEICMQKESSNHAEEVNQMSKSNVKSSRPMESQDSRSSQPFYGQRQNQSADGNERQNQSADGNDRWGSGREQEKKMGQNGIVQPLLTDFYQISMAYAYWKSEKSEARAVFDLFFRKNPFHGEFTIFAGLEECLKFIEKFSYSESDIEYIKQILPPNIEEEFYQYLGSLTAKDIKLYAVKEGTVVFPRVPLLRVEGPLIVAQLLETTLLTLVNFASLMAATNAARYRMAAGKLKLYEFGLRRAQGPDGGLSASKYSYIGGFDGTSNVLAGKLFNIPVKGTHAHSYITSFREFSEVTNKELLPNNGGTPQNLLELAINFRKSLISIFNVLLSEVSDGELAAFVSFALALPNSFMALVDTYDVKKSGLINFCATALALHELGYKAIGVRLDSGDLAYLSIVAREYFQKVGKEYNIPYFSNLIIMASNDINEETILSLNEQGHCIDAFGIGTHLVTCQKQPALGCVYKMVDLNDQPRIKLSQDVQKVTIPGKKDAYRLYGEAGYALIDILQQSLENPPKEGQKVLCRHPFQESKRAFVIPSKVEKLLVLRFEQGKICQPLGNLQEVRKTVEQSLKILRPDIKRTLNPTPFKVSVSDDLYQFLHTLWLENTPIGELS